MASPGPELRHRLSVLSPLSAGESRTPDIQASARLPEVLTLPPTNKGRRVVEGVMESSPEQRLNPVQRCLYAWSVPGPQLAQNEWQRISSRGHQGRLCVLDLGGACGGPVPWERFGSAQTARFR